eukprot:357784-Chlamydomonas_euryale.AAC.3
MLVVPGRAACAPPMQAAGVKKDPTQDARRPRQGGLRTAHKRSSGNGRDSRNGHERQGLADSCNGHERQKA